MNGKASESDLAQRSSEEKSSPQVKYVVSFPSSKLLLFSQLLKSFRNMLFTLLVLDLRLHTVDGVRRLHSRVKVLPANMSQHSACITESVK